MKQSKRGNRVREEPELPSYKTGTKTGTCSKPSDTLRLTALVWVVAARRHLWQEHHRALHSTTVLTLLWLWLESWEEERKEELAHLPVNDAFALQEEEADGYFCCVESAMKGLKGTPIIKGDELK